MVGKWVMKNYQVLNNEELLTLYKKVNEYIKTLEEDKKAILEMENKEDDK